jgi:hypothetical protein
MFALLFSAIWWDVKRDQTGIQSLVGLIFMAVVRTYVTLRRLTCTYVWMRVCE